MPYVQNPKTQASGESLGQVKIPNEVQQTRIPIPGSDQDTITKPYLK